MAIPAKYPALAPGISVDVMSKKLAKGKSSEWFTQTRDTDPLNRAIVADKDFRDCMKFIVGDTKFDGVEGGVTPGMDSLPGDAPFPAYTGITGSANGEFFAAMNELIMGDFKLWINPTIYEQNVKRIMPYVYRYYYVKYYRDYTIAGYKKPIITFTRPSRVIMMCWMAVPGQTRTRLPSDPRILRPIEIDYRLYYAPELIVDAFAYRTASARTKANWQAIARQRIKKFKSVFPKRLYANYLGGN